MTTVAFVSGGFTALPGAFINQGVFLTVFGVLGVLYWFVGPTLGWFADVFSKRGTYQSLGEVLDPGWRIVSRFIQLELRGTFQGFAVRVRDVTPKGGWFKMAIYLKCPVEQNFTVRASDPSSIVKKPEVADLCHVVDFFEVYSMARFQWDPYLWDLLPLQWLHLRGLLLILSPKPPPEPLPGEDEQLMPIYGPAEFKQALQAMVNLANSRSIIYRT